MPFNGSGVYQAPPLPASFNPATTGGSATPADWNTLLADLSTALSTTITKDGQTTVTASIPMANHKITGLGDATAQTDALNQRGALYVIDQQDATAVSFVDFTNLAATVNNLTLTMEGTVSGSAASLILQTYGADGILDTGGSDYGQNISIVRNGAFTAASTTGSSISLVGNVDAGNLGFSGTVVAANIQALTDTKFQIGAQSFSSAGYDNLSGAGFRSEADRITGLRVSISTGTFTGKFTLLGSV